MSSLNLAIVASVYPSDQKPHAGTFIEQIVQAMANSGTRISVIAPQTYRLSNLLKRKSMDYSVRNPSIQVLRPRNLSFSNYLLPGHYSTLRWSIQSFTQAVTRVQDRLSPIPDCCYGHFIYPSGIAAANLAQHFDIPAVVAVGESSLAFYETHLGLEKMRQDITRFDGIIAVSNENRTYCIERLGYSPQKIISLPNAIDNSLFYVRDRQEMRKRHNLPLDRPIIIFVGHFNERKGPLRVLQAIEPMPEVGAIFLGNGKALPSGPQVLFAGPVAHSEIPEWLSAADLFVLPTLAEGSCNAILEAMACGLPIVSSDLPFNHEVLDHTMACMVNPHDIHAISQAIQLLLSDEQLRRNMGQAGLARTELYTLHERSHLILEWLQKNIMN